MFPYPEQYRLATPPLTTSFMVFWALLSHSIFADASPFALYPLMALFPLVVFSHVFLIWNAQGLSRLDQGFYALVHIPLAFVVWTFTIMHVNGNAFS
ncbi:MULTISPECIES: hypothetical protein [unclassified Shewanella]|uniref:hypothetical protein n=1 Tax=unclassified Shewanella TaxID=196818 RepID=UPI000C8494FA|nr:MULTISPECIES: hypothetical protein [unclassified Shewanella]MDO6620302.1 hypothetical protein [Shewanella sp. 6_MG-2023]MDO6679504.1 hypothetical protein [Shewanella sp. 4_MG-2023]MDO6774591.1 hypothetical protein [Shewanella sp. 3_MG-2023]PMG32251.1 hypothetical protein BCU94_00565 [Shewanella sp. 10N.286.52.C2]PMG45231.1 hypothetical protein BCU91_04055 [Shewanella sp. 10N.286.52.B9]